MRTLTKIIIGAAGTATLATVALGIRRVMEDRRMARIERALREKEAGKPVEETFSEAMVDNLPAPARHYLLHAIQPGTPLAQSVRLRISGRMRPREGADLIDFTADETLAPPRGFVWTARLKMGLLPLRVQDHYVHGDGAVAVHGLGIVPIGRDAGPDVTRSSRHRLAGESIWLPSSLLSRAGVRWTAVDENRARVTLTIDGEVIPLTLQIDETGRLREVTMARYGDVGVEAWQPIPYGFAVEDEQTFEGYTIPSALRGGWWYGTDRYDAEEASHFHIQEASFH